MTFSRVAIDPFVGVHLSTYIDPSRMKAVSVAALGVDGRSFAFGLDWRCDSISTVCLLTAHDPLVDGPGRGARAKARGPGPRAGARGDGRMGGRPGGIGVLRAGRGMGENDGVGRGWGW